MLIEDSQPNMIEEQYDTPRTVQPTRRRRNYHALNNNSIASFDTGDSTSMAANSDERKSRGEQSEMPPDNPKWAIFYFVMYTVFSTYNLIAGKFFRTWYPQMSTFQLLFYRGFSACIVLIVYMGKDTKKQLIDNVNTDNFSPLSFRIF